jgi:hypothetical protein
VLLSPTVAVRTIKLTMLFGLECSRDRDPSSEIPHHEENGDDSQMHLYKASLAVQ